MKTLYFDTFSGMSGDMCLGLLIDLGVPPEHLEQELARLPISGYRLEINREQRHGIEGCRVRVHCEETHHHRSWSSIDRMLAESDLNTEVSALARRFFRRLGEAEAKVHGIDIDRVHFHEVGAVDAIIDLVGTAIGLIYLRIERFFCSPLPLSRGMSRCAHGALPLPAPATLEILRGQPVTDSGCERELVTPTGATIAAEIATFGPLPDLTLDTTGYGVGGWELEDRPNLLRGLLFSGDPAADSEEIRLLESHIDDSTPEQLGYLMDRLFAAGALDVAYSPLQMKKNRPGQMLKVVCTPHRAHPLAELIMQQSSAIGVRSSACTRYRLERRPDRVITDLGTARVKLIYQGERLLRIAPEYDDCRALAEAGGLPLHDVYQRVQQAGHEQLAALSREGHHD